MTTEFLAIASERASLSTLARWNLLMAADAVAAVLPCCGSRAWAEGLSAGRPFTDKAALLVQCEAAWQMLAPQDWQEAFDSHPRLGEAHAKSATAPSLQWSADEQRQAAPGDMLRSANARYEEKFGRIFLLCADGRTTPEILAALESRMRHDAKTEWREACEQQRQITQLRLQRWLQAG